MKVVFAYGSETGMGASIVEEAYAVASESLPDIDMALPEELGNWKLCLLMILECQVWLD